MAVSSQNPRSSAYNSDPYARYVPSNIAAFQHPGSNPPPVRSDEQWGRDLQSLYDNTPDPVDNAVNPYASDPYAGYLTSYNASVEKQRGAIDASLKNVLAQIGARRDSASAIVAALPGQSAANYATAGKDAKIMRTDLNKQLGGAQGKGEGAKIANADNALFANNLSSNLASVKNVTPLVQLGVNAQADAGINAINQQAMAGNQALDQQQAEYAMRAGEAQANRQSQAAAWAADRSDRAEERKHQDMVDSTNWLRGVDEKNKDRAYESNEAQKAREWNASHGPNQGDPLDDRDRAYGFDNHAARAEAERGSAYIGAAITLGATDPKNNDKRGGRYSLLKDYANQNPNIIKALVANGKITPDEGAAALAGQYNGFESKGAPGSSSGRNWWDRLTASRPSDYF